MHYSTDHTRAQGTSWQPQRSKAWRSILDNPCSLIRMFSMITTVTGKNQITIPAKLASQLDIQPGTRLDWSLGQDGVLIVSPLPSRGELARRAAGMARAWLPEGADPVADLVEERLRDEAAEEQQ